VKTGPATLPAPAGGRDLRRLLGDLLVLPLVRGGLVVAPDGLVIASQLPPGSPVEALSALAASLGRELELRGARRRQGGFVLAHFRSAEGTIFLGGTPVGFIVVLADDSADRDQVRHALRTAVETVRRTWTR
jgi:predicted regulator of Ras-like GTPase activity (Roadblock/LC7/MglB family)